MQQVYVYGVDDVRLQPAERPAVGPGDALLQVAACGICGSDLAYVSMGGLMGPSGEPMPLGHELSGTIVELGEAVTGFEVGQRVVVNPVAGDNHIGNGGPEGGFTQYLLVRNANRANCLFALPDSLSDEQGALVEPLGVAMHAVNQGEAAPGDRVVVFGTGPIGLGTIACLRYRGVDDIVAVDMSEKRLAIARQLGAREVIRADDANLWQRIAECHGTVELYGAPVAATDLFIDAAGAGPVIRGILDNCRFGARVVVVALHKQEVSLPVFQIMAKELVIKGSMAYPDEFGAVIGMLESGEVDVSPMITHRFPLGEFPRAFETAKQADMAAKVMVYME